MKKKLSALMIAAKTNATWAIKLLLENGIDPNVADRKGHTALTYSIMSENAEAIEILLPKTTYKLDISLRALAETPSTFEASQKIKDDVQEIIREAKKINNKS